MLASFVALCSRMYEFDYRGALHRISALNALSVYPTPKSARGTLRNEDNSSKLPLLKYIRKVNRENLPSKKQLTYVY